MMGATGACVGQTWSRKDGGTQRRKQPKIVVEDYVENAM